MFILHEIKGGNLITNYAAAISLVSGVGFGGAHFDFLWIFRVSVRQLYKMNK